jgi:integrase
VSVPLRLVEGAGEAGWRAALEAAVRPEFGVDVYVPDPGDAWLHGPPCAVEGCEAPRFRPINGRGGVYVCSGHHQNFRTHGRADPLGWLAAAGPLRGSARRAGAYAPRYRLTATSPALATELRYGLQCWHDGHHSTRLSAGRWSCMLQALERVAVGSVLEIDPGLVRELFGRRGEVSFVRRTVERFRRETLGENDRHADVWFPELYEGFALNYRKRPARMDFIQIQRRWLREIVKRVTWARMAHQGVGPVSAYRTVGLVAYFERWAGDRLDRGPTAIDRPLLEDYLAHVRRLPFSGSDREARLAALQSLLELSRALGIEAFHPSAGYLPGEIGQRSQKTKPRYYDAHVTAQLDDPANLARLTDPNARIALLVMRHAGLRISSACSLRLDCLVEDPAGQSWLRYLDHKGDEEDLVPISSEIAGEIGAQQRRARERFPETPWLLPGVRANPEGRKHASDCQVRDTLRRWVRACDIRDRAGDPIAFKPHRFRHTIATELLNRGMSTTAVRRFLSHRSEAMTQVYAHMHDDTLKREWLQTKQRINSRGERVELVTPEIDDEAAWLKHQLARAKQTLPDGECGLPIQQSCPHPNRCHSCPHFLTHEGFRPVLESQLERAERRIATASAEGHDRIVEINTPDVLDLRRILDGLDRLEADTAARAPDADFDLRASLQERAS